jgi:DNA-binding response OmpR family regulator
MKFKNIRPSVLVVDDQRMFRCLVQNVLEPEGFKIFCAEDSIEALNILINNNIDLIVLDIVMPGKDGVHLCKEIKDNITWKEIPVIFLSSLSTPDEIVNALNTGAVDYVQKPFNKDEFILRVKNQLEVKFMNDNYQFQLEELRKSNRYLLSTLHEISKVMDDARVSN